MVDTGNTATPVHAQAKPIPLTSEQRKVAQALFLEAYRESANVKYSCQVAHINRVTFYRWKANDKAFAALLAEAEPDACDTLEYAAYERAVKGIESYVVSQGKLVYDPDGKPLVERKYSDTLLITLLKARIPEKYRDKQQIDLNAQITTLADTAKAELLADLEQAILHDGQASPS